MLIVLNIIPDTGVSSLARRLPFVDPEEALDAVRDFVDAFLRGDA